MRSVLFRRDLAMRSVVLEFKDRLEKKDDRYLTYLYQRMFFEE